MRTQNQRGPGAPLSTARTEAFSDGVFAVAITLLVLNLQVPQLASEEWFNNELPHLWSKVLIYMLSFVVVGIYWVAHHNTFHYISRSDRNLLWLNILFLMCIVFIPFPTALLGQYTHQQTPVIIYAGTLVITGLVLQSLWWYVTSNYRLVDREIDPQLVKKATRRNLLAPLIYLLAIGISFLKIEVSLALLVLVPVLYIFPGRIDRYWTQRQSHDKTNVSANADTTLTHEETPPPRGVSAEQK
ncbi:MAG: TMEM175 family protein [Chloroflexota bacterium]|nr:TMEM175 family protein [Chloroflexota bacterium]